MKKVVIFGGCGFLGGYVSNELERRGYKIVVADVQQSDYLQDAGKFRKVDIMNIDTILKVIEGAHIVYNFAAIADLEDAINLPVETININVIGNLNILEACRETKTIERFVYASSAYALSDEGSFYGISKQTSEKLTEEYYKRYGLIYTVIRYGSIYGEKPSHNNYIYNLIKDSMISGKLEYKGDGQDIREYIHASDVAKLSVDVIEDSQYENEHIILTGIEKLKRIELLTMIREIMQNKLTIEKIDNNNFGHYKITPYSFHPTVGKKLVANPYIDLEQGLLECIQEIHKELKIK
jgi:UDP-glucose 4-epimerase